MHLLSWNVVYNLWTVFVPLIVPQKHTETKRGRRRFLLIAARLAQSGRQKKLHASTSVGSAEQLRDGYRCGPYRPDRGPTFLPPSILVVRKRGLRRGCYVGERFDTSYSLIREFNRSLNPTGSPFVVKVVGAFCSAFTVSNAGLPVASHSGDLPAA